MSLIILNFHGVGPIPRDLDDGERDCWLDEDVFETVLDLLRDQRHVQLTFDDGNASDAEIALPALLQRGLQAMFFVCTGRLDQPTFLTRTQLRGLFEHGMRVGSHGVAHIRWRGLPPERLRVELEGSRRVLETVCDEPVEAAACPFGAYDRTVLKELRHAGYRRVYTSDGGICGEEDRLQPRTTVTRGMTPTAIMQLVQRGPSLWQQWSTNARSLIKRFR